jgi:dihydrofolate reductase
MKSFNSVFIATSLDGYIADKNGGIDWLHSMPNPTNDDMGYSQFMDRIDAIVMGRNTFETVLGFDIKWPYSKPVFVLSSSLQEIPEELKDRVTLLNLKPAEVVKKINSSGYKRLYIDGGKTIQTFLKEGLIDELIITIIPIILGDGTPLFNKQEDRVEFACIKSEVFLERIVQNQYVRHEIN